MDGGTLDEEGRGRCLIPHLEIQFVLACRYHKCLGHSKLQFAIEGKIELSLTGNGDRLFVFEVKLVRELYRHIV